MKTSVVLVEPGKKIFSMTYPLGLGYIDAVLKQNNCGVKILNYSGTDISVVKIVREIVKMAPDAVGFTVYSFNYNSVKKIILELKKAVSAVKILLGGPHISALPKESLEDLKADFCVVGEGEFAVLEIIKRIKSKCDNFSDLKGIAYWHADMPKLNEGCNLIEGLDNLPFPTRGFNYLNRYNNVAGDLFRARHRVAPILTSRGCPHQCSFCASRFVHGQRLRLRSAESVVDEIEYLNKRYNVKEILIFDDTFSEDRKHAAEICRRIIGRNLTLTWRTPVGVRLQTLDAELLRLFKDSGCCQLGLGIESFSSDILSEMKKPIVKSEISDKISLIKRFDIETMGYFILGLPGDTEGSVRESIKFARDSQLDYLSFTYAIPLPGTEIFKKLYKERVFGSIDWDNFFFYTSRPFNVSSVPEKKLKKLYFSAYWSCYSNPKRLIKIFKKIILLRKITGFKTLKFIYYIIKNLL